jgi:uncharacterized protein (DUF58 family)
VVTTLVESGADIGASTLDGETPLQISIRFGQRQVARVLRELERSARTKEEAAAKEATQQAIDQAERMGALLIEEEERDQAAERKVRGCSTLTLAELAELAELAPGWMVCPSDTVERIMTCSGDGARTTG